MTDDIAAAMVATMDDDELAEHIAELRRLLAVTPRDHPGNERLIIAWGRACATANTRGIATDDGQGDDAPAGEDSPGPSPAGHPGQEPR